MLEEPPGVNAAEQATNPETASKIAAMVSLFKRQFPEVKANLQPWTNDPTTRELVDPDSIDVAFNLPAGNTLVQVRFYENRLIGVEAICFGRFGNQRWQFSTVGEWSFQGSFLPPAGFQDRLKQVCREIFVLFNGSDSTNQV